MAGKIGRPVTAGFLFWGCTLVMAFALPGDTTNDGVLDGRDALKIMRHVEGLEILAPAEQTAADVHPAPGTDGRTIGDGVINEDDALRILYRAVGLIPEGEITGDYSGSAPRILDFTPRSGPVGTWVIINGRNFVGAWPGENQAFFSGMQSPIESISNWRIITRVPEGALSGALSVKTPGGTAFSALEFTVTEEVQGRVDLGAGLNPADFTVTNVLGETTPNAATGEFTLMLPRDKPALIGAVPKGTGENCFLALYLPAAVGAPAKSRGTSAQLDSLVVDAQSTAYTLIFMHPFLMTTEMETVRSLFAVMEPLPAVQNLVQVIGQRYPQGANGLDDPSVEAAWGQAVGAVLEALPDGAKFDKTLPARSLACSSEQELDESHGGGNVCKTALDSPVSLADSPAAPTVRIWGIDLDYLAFRYNAEGNEISPRLITDYSPVDWLVAMYRLDPKDMPKGLNERFAALKKQNIRRQGYEKSTMVAGNLWTAKIDILGQGLDFVMGTALDWVGLGGDDPNLPLESHEDAVYMIRAFSGSFKDRWQFSGDDAVAMKAFEGDIRLGNYATGINVTLALIDIWGLVAGEEGTPGKEAIKGAFQNALAALASELGGRALGDLSTNDALKSLLNVVVEAGKGVASAYANEGISKAQDKLQGTLKKAFGKAIPLLEILSKISSVGRIGERIVGLMGYIVSPLDLEIVYGPTPLEAAFVIVGDPFSPVIESFSPEMGGPTMEITLTGRRFDPDLADNQVWFGDVKAEAVSVKPDGTELVVRVPFGLNEYSNPLSIKVDTPSSLRAAGRGGFLFRDIPVLHSLSVTEGYGKSSNPAGKPFAEFQGTYVTLNGYKLGVPASGPNIEVYFGATQAIINSQSTAQLKVYVPALSSTGPHDVYVRYRDSQGAWDHTQHLTFNVLGPPQITSLTPTTVPAAALLDIQGQNLLNCEVYIHGSIANYRVLESKQRIAVTMPNVGEPGETMTVELWTPAGMASREITRQPGIQSPAPNPPGGGFTLYVNSAEALITPDGQLTLDEAMAFARGELNFWILGNNYDDKNEKWIHHWYQRRFGSEGEYYYQWEEDVTIDKQILEENNGPAHEQRGHFIVYHYHPDNGGTVTEPTQHHTEDLDSGADEEHKTEEGDRCNLFGYSGENYANVNGANTLDWIRFVGGTRTYYSTTGLRLGRYDVLVAGTNTLGIRGGTNELLEGVVIEAPAIESELPILITGNLVNINPSSGHSEIEFRNGGELQIQQAFGVHIGDARFLNVSGNALSITNGGRCFIRARAEKASGTGFLLTGSDENELYLQASGCGGAGLLLQNSRMNTVSELNADSCGGAGVEITGGRSNELYVGDIGKCASGVAMTDTEFNRMNWTYVIHECLGNGITITGGQANHLDGNSFSSIHCRQNGGHGVEIVNSPMNNIFGVESAGNSGSGLLVQGSASQYNLVEGFTAGRYKDRNTVETILFGNKQHGIHVRNGAANNQFGTENLRLRIVANDGHGVFIEGDNTSHNTFLCRVGYWHSDADFIMGGNGGDGFRLADGASHNLIIHSQSHGNESNGITLQDEGTEYNRIEDSWVGTVVLRDAQQNQTPKPNLGMGIWVASGARFTLFKNTSVGIHSIGGAFVDNMSQIPPDGEWNVSFVNCMFGATNLVQLPSEGGGTAVKTEAMDTPGKATALLDISPGIGLQINGVTHCRLDSADFRYYKTGLLLGGPPTTGHYLDVTAAYCTQAGIQIENVRDQKIHSIGSDNCDGHGIWLKNCANITMGSGVHSAFNNGGNGLLVESCDTAALGSLSLYMNGQNGLQIEKSKNISALDCNIGRNQQDGVAITGGSDTVNYRGGYMEDNTGYCIRIEDSTNVVAAPQSADSTFSLWFGAAGGVLVRNSGAVQIGDEFPNQNMEITCENSPAIYISGTKTTNVRVMGTWVSMGSRADMPCCLVDEGSNILIGHQDARFANLFNGEGWTGVRAQGSVSGLRILNNTLGAPPRPEFSLGSNQFGLVLDQGIQGVVVAGNLIHHGESHGVVIQGGANANAFSGNTITRNSGDGVRISGATARRNLLSRNIITDNAGKGITLAGGNDNIATPLITNISPGSRAVSGSIHPVPPAGTRVEVYADRGDEGESLLGISPVFGNNFSITSPIPPGRQLHAIAIHPNGNTSEFGDSQQEELPENHPFVFAEGKPGSRVIKAADPDWPLPCPVIVSPHDDFSPRMDPNGAALLFTSDRNGNLDLFHHRIEAEITTPIAIHAADDFDPAGHAATGKIAFVSLRDGNAEIYSIPDYQTTETTRLTNNPAEDRHPAWSPNGDRIAFASNRGGNMDIWIMNADGSTPQRLTDGTGTNTQPAWSPDGASIAFVSNRDGNNEIYTIGVDGSNLSRMTNDPADDCNPAWTANGTFILFSSNRESGYEIYSVQTTTRRVNRLTIAPLDAMQPHAGVQWSGFAPLSTRALAKPVSTRSTGSRDADANALKTAPTVITASAADDAVATLTLLNTSAIPGQTVAVTMQFRASPGAVPPSGVAGNLAWELRYDPAVFEVVEPPAVGLGLGPCAVAPAQFPDDSGVLIVNGVRASGVGGDGNALTFRLRVKASATPQRSPIRFQSAEAWSLDYLGIPLGTQDAELAVDYQPARGVFWILIGQD